MPIPDQTFARVIQHANAGGTGPSSAVGRTVSKTSATQPARTLQSAKGGDKSSYTMSSGSPTDTGASAIQTKPFSATKPFDTAPPTDPNLARAQKVWTQDINALNDPTGYLKLSGQIASTEISPQVRDLIASGRIGANNIVQFNRGQQQLLSQLPSQIGDIYNQGIGMENQIARSTGAALQAATPSAATIAALQSTGASPEQMQQYAAQNFLGYNTGGAALTGLGNIPAMTLNQQKLAAQAYAQTLPALSKIQAGQALSSYEQNQTTAMGKILAQQPALAAKLFSTITSSKSAAAKQLGSYINQAQNVAIKKAGLNLQAAGLNEKAIKDSNTAVYQNGQLILGGENADTASRRADNQAIHDAAMDSNAADRNSLYDRRTNIMVTNAANTLALNTQKALGFQIVTGPDGKQYVQPMAGYRAKMTPSGAVVTWKVPTGGKPGGVTPGEYSTKLQNFQTWAGKAGKPAATKATGGPYRWVSTGQGSGKWIPNQNYVPGAQPGPTVSYQEALNHALSMGISRKDAINQLNTTPGFEVGTNGNYWPTLRDALSNVTQSAVHFLNLGHNAREIYKSALASGGFNPNMLPQVRYTINRIATQHYFFVHPNAKALPAGVLIEHPKTRKPKG